MIEPPKPEPIPVFREKPQKITKLYEKQYSVFMPLISNVSPLSDNSDNNNYNNKKSLNDLIQKYKSLKNEIPNDIINEKNDGLSENGVSFCIPNGVTIKKEEDRNNNCVLEPSLCNNARYIFFDKNKPEIKFKT